MASGRGSWNLHVGGGGRRAGDVNAPPMVKSTTPRAISGSRRPPAASGRAPAATSAELSTTTTPLRDSVRRGWRGRADAAPTFVYDLEGASRELTPASWRPSVPQPWGPPLSHTTRSRVRESARSFTNNLRTLEVLAGAAARWAAEGHVRRLGVSRAPSTRGGKRRCRRRSTRGDSPVRIRGADLVARDGAIRGAASRMRASRPKAGCHRATSTDLSGVTRASRPADRPTTMAVSVARAARNPALEELYFIGPHPGNFAFEIGNPDLDFRASRSGLDSSFRWRQPRGSGESHLLQERDRTTSSSADPRRSMRSSPRTSRSPEEIEAAIDCRRPVLRADAKLQGVEFHTDLELTQRAHRGGWRSTTCAARSADLDQPLPRIPPVPRHRWAELSDERVPGRVGRWRARPSRIGCSARRRPTAGYGLLKLFGIVLVPDRQSDQHDHTARLDNVTDELYRNHLSYIKDFVPEMGGTFKVMYSVRF